VTVNRIMKLLNEASQPRPPVATAPETHNEHPGSFLSDIFPCRQPNHASAMCANTTYRTPSSNGSIGRIHLSSGIWQTVFPERAAFDQFAGLERRLFGLGLGRCEK
jgi:hypothetical protein